MVPSFVRAVYHIQEGLSSSLAGWDRNPGPDNSDRHEDGRLDPGS